MQDNNASNNYNNISDEALDEFISSGAEMSEESIEKLIGPTENADNQEVVQQPANTQNVSQDTQKQDDLSTEEERNYRIAMLEERDKRRELQRRLQETEERGRQAETKLQQIIDQINQNSPRAPNFEEAPLESLKYEQEMLKRSIEQEQHQVRQMIDYQREQAFMSQYKDDATRFSTQNPDFKEAYSSLMNGRFQELTAFGFSPEHANNIMLQEEAGIVSKAYQDRVNPAERLYQVAKMRGYNPTASKQQQPAPKSEIQQLAKAKEAGMSLSNTSGGASNKNADITLEALLAMEDDDFLANFDKVMKKR